MCVECVKERKRDFCFLLCFLSAFCLFFNSAVERENFFVLICLLFVLSAVSTAMHLEPAQAMQAMQAIQLAMPAMVLLPCREFVCVYV